MIDRYTEKVHVQIVRQPHSTKRMMFCMTCRKGILKYSGRLITICPGDPDAEGESVTKFPFEIKCSGQSETYGPCPMLYIIEGFVE